MEELIEALKAQAVAIDKLATNIGLLVQAMAEADGEEVESTTYLDWSMIK